MGGISTVWIGAVCLSRRVLGYVLLVVVGVLVRSVRLLVDLLLTIHSAYQHQDGNSTITQHVLHDTVFCCTRVNACSGVGVCVCTDRSAAAVTTGTGFCAFGGD